MPSSQGPKNLFRRRRSRRTVALAAVVTAMAVVALFGVWLLFKSLGSGTETGASPSPSVTTRRSSTHKVGKPKIKGVVVQVLNGTDRSHLASTTSQELAKAGYTTTPPGNSDSRRKVTLVAYRPKFLADASFLKRKYFPHAVLQKSVVSFPSGADITVVLGTDASG